MKILHISKYYFPYIGGVENICKYLVEGATGHETAVVCFDEERHDCVDVVNGHRVWRVGTWMNVARQALSPTYFSVLRQAIKEFRPDVIQFYWANPFPAAVLLAVIPKDVKLVIHWHMDIIKQKRIYPLIKSVETALLKRADLVVVTSPNYRDHSLPLQPFKEKVRVVPNAMDESVMMLRDGDDEAIEQIKERHGNKPIVFFVGRHIQYKGLPNLIEAAQYVKTNCKIVIAGSGPLTEELKAQCKSDKVVFVGRLSDDDLRRYHYAAMVFAFPSITKNEAFGVALAEAMYAGTPAVTFTIEGSGVNWVSINNETCLEVENGNARAYAEAIDRLLTDEKLWQRLSEAGEQRVKENFTIPYMIEEMNKCYDVLLINVIGGGKSHITKLTTEKETSRKVRLTPLYYNKEGGMTKRNVKPLEELRVAIIQEWLVTVGGSDKVVKAILDVFPQADVYTLVAKKEICDELAIPWEKVHTSFIQKLPLGTKKHRAYLPLFPYAIEQFDLRGYDIVISSSHCVAKGVMTKADQLHICYCHSPIRYVWDMYNEYLEESHLAKGFKSWLVRMLLHRIRKYDIQTANRVDYYISNSDYVGRRIAKTYRRDSTTIHPNIDITSFEYCGEKQDYYLASSRLVAYKRIDMIVEAFNKMPDKKLVVIGGGPQLEMLRKMAGKNIEVMGYQPFDVLKEKMQHAKAFVFAADEDFGMIPIEAQACGTPVIAYGHGGSLETVNGGKTGMFFYEQTADAVMNAVNEFEAMGEQPFKPENCRQWAEGFSEERFKREIKDFVLSKYNEFHDKGCVVLK